jgi:hypothetical protein
MVFEGHDYKTHGEIFDKAVEVAKTGNPDKCQAFVDSYASVIIAVNVNNGGERMTVSEAIDQIKQNLLYYSERHYDGSVSKLLTKAFFK